MKITLCLYFCVNIITISIANIAFQYVSISYWKYKHLIFCNIINGENIHCIAFSGNFIFLILPENILGFPRAQFYTTLIWSNSIQSVDSSSTREHTLPRVQIVANLYLDLASSFNTRHDNFLATTARNKTRRMANS